MLVVLSPKYSDGNRHYTKDRKKRRNLVEKDEKRTTLSFYPILSE